jgi:GntR family transcriptional regulator of arabinose operon
MMLDGIDKNSTFPLYMQLKNIIIERINSGELKRGSPISTEHELCSTYGISRFPVRQAMEVLVKEGYLTRTRGRGTFVSEELPETVDAGRKKMLGFIIGGFTEGFGGQILKGYEKQARKRGYLTIACSHEFDADEELRCIRMLVESGAAGIDVFSCDDSKISSIVSELNEKKIYLGLLDRNPELTGLDYIGSDNAGGAYTALRHLAMQGYRNVAFVSYKSMASSINERLDGYLKAVENFGLKSITHIDMEEELQKYPYPMHRFFVEDLKDELVDLKKHIPLGIFAINDGIALQCMRILRDEGLVIGRDVGIVGFDNITEGEFSSPPLTSVAQNGLLIGQ